ncbi:hypothetical protein C8Q80DRAFT_245254 [Daedaleopsis nitida]|nr:hypothetical protein C8Q80DRAFT_245254 [Daedaleopsis nitida]
MQISRAVNLYRFVCLSSASQLYAFIWTLRQQEWKGTLVRELHITPSDRSRYLPFCHGVLVSRLSRLETLVLRNVDLRGYYPPYYHQLIAQFRVNNLTLADCGVSLGQLLPLIRSMRTLRTLRLLCKSPHLVHAPNALVTTQSRDLPLAESLTLVELEDPFFAHSPQDTGRQPAGLRGVSLGAVNPPR